jgi:AbrB family looped-hinge helix DNA binding protein
MAFAIVNGMSTTVSVDNAGRIVLPKALREQFNLRPGTELELTAGADHLELKPLENLPSLVRSGSLWVHQGATNVPIGDAVREMRDDRIGDLVRKAGR